jgi:hypothetical protein
MHRYQYQMDSVSSSVPSPDTNGSLHYLFPKSISEIEPEELNVETFDSLLHDILDDFDQQLSCSSLGDHLMVKMLIISLFSVHHSASKDHNILLHAVSVMPSSNSANSTQSAHESQFNCSASINSRSITESLALISLFGLINRYFRCLQYAFLVLNFLIELRHE